MAAKRTARATAPVQPAPVVALDTITQEEISLTKEVGIAIAKFMVDAVAFFTEAKRLEGEALALRDASKLWVEPTTAEEDEALQLHIKRAGKGKRVIGEHWKLITSVVFQFHRRLTGRRDKGVTACEEAADTGNKLHNRYTAAAQRRADELNRLALVEAEAWAWREREVELEGLEAEALRQEAATKGLSAREQRFVELVSFGLNAPTTAARAAGFKDPQASGDRLMKAAKIQDAITAAKNAQALRRQSAAVRALPVDVGQVETVKADITRAVGAHDVTRWSAELFDAALLKAAVLRGEVPSDVLTVDETKLNQYARDMHELINAWPGVRAKSDTKVQ